MMNCCVVAGAAAVPAEVISNPPTVGVTVGMVGAETVGGLTVDALVVAGIVKVCAGVVPVAGTVAVYGVNEDNTC